jgi:hypothetical protein
MSCRCKAVVPDERSNAAMPTKRVELDRRMCISDKRHRYQVLPCDFSLISVLHVDSFSSGTSRAQILSGAAHLLVAAETVVAGGAGRHGAAAAPAAAAAAAAAGLAAGHTYNVAECR